ncbi:NERD domain-containing protein [Bacillus salipaludis]|uniref:NERD domain-containing protein n=1 Tax=Bacillus salipaludis TaxID=2547811 RepID=A0A4R5VUZ8_9BACI|nr:nuclease-related domain-containing protein [Bacillus salipaludis]MDQ6597547.1 nuclease-related domain-containing protein [Bacillus salipaludis]TDK63034.1 NERD domain-containing protein [Bacillus salipaludis]
MIIKPRLEPKNLKVLRSLNTRMNLSEDDRQNYLNLKKGYEGEVMFDELTNKLQCECYILNDLLFKVNNTLFQIDSLIITQKKIHLFEVKNYEGDYFYEKEAYNTRSKSEIKNPVLQLKRSESLLRQLLYHLSYHYPIEAFVVFINPQFTLYQAPLNEPIIFPTQIKRYLAKFDLAPSSLNENHRNLASKLLSVHVEESPYKNIPSYQYNTVQKGLTCEKCLSFLNPTNGNKCKCHQCGHEEEVESAVLRMVEEIKLLFPEIKITTKLVYDWCRVIESRKRICRVLKKHFNIIGARHYAFYVEKLNI